LEGHCQKCGVKFNHKKGQRGTTHHILPQRFFKGHGATMLLCDTCHTELEKLIPQTPKLTRSKYWKIAWDFIQGGV
jgi:hypothetical protein